MSARRPSSSEEVRAAELVGALCLATDLAMAFPFEHGLQSTLIGARLADRLGVDHATRSRVYYACLLAHAGCTTDAHVTAEVFGDSLTKHFHPRMYGSSRAVLSGLVRALPEPDRPAPVRALQTVRGLPKMARTQRPHLTAMCEVGEMLAGRVGAPPEVAGLLAYATDRWDGKGPLRRGKAEGIPLEMRIVHVALDAALQRSLGGPEHAVSLVRERAGTAFDPEVANCFVKGADEILSLEAGSVWAQTLASEPAPALVLGDAELDRGFAAMGSFADLISPHFTGHSAGVAELASAAAARCRLDMRDSTMLRRAAFVQDLGRVAVGVRVWQTPGPLGADRWEEVRLHPYHTERVLSRSPFLAALGSVAGAHHERLDGSGYHRGATAAELSLPARLLAAADAYQAMAELRPHRPALTPERAAAELAGEARAGRLDADAVTAVIEAAGQRAPRLERPAGLTAREAEVIGLLARGLQTKQVARELEISVKTADRHIQNAYRKIGVSTRAAATLFAMEHGLVAWGELPIAGASGRS